MIDSICRGTPRRRRISAAASGSVGETIAPSTNATGHDMPSTSAWATTATVHIVASTSPIANTETTRMPRRMSCRFAKKADEYSSGGRKITSTRSGSSVTVSSVPSTNPRPRPPITSTIG